MITLRPSNRRAVALVIVLAILLLLSGLLVAFMGKVGTERASSAAVAKSFEAKQAYDSAVNLVMSQIRDGTRNTTDGKRSWASQPGLIRTFDNATSPAEGKIYKLYSSDRMVMESGAYNPSSPGESGLNADFTAPDSSFVDLNDPVLLPIPGNALGQVEPHYPIVNPYARQTVNGAEPLPGHGVVEGFVAADVAHKSKQVGKNGKPILALPMRTKWLYQLKDGTFITQDSSGNIPGASKVNPPVARVAFWTDDEASKININTASENTFWSTPHASCYQESGNVNGSGQAIYDPNGSNALAASQPTAMEYQRFPGHPATTSLSPALRWLAASKTDLDYKEAIYRLSPRYMGGYGSSMATSRNPEFDTDFRIAKRDRLYSTLDEYWFRPDRSPISGSGLYGVFRPTGSQIKDTPFVDSTLGADALEKTRFFLTASSRSPELNLFGMPRVCIWPVNEIDDPTPSKSKRSGFDDLITFCSTIAAKPYVFSRKDNFSPTYDYEQSGADSRKGGVVTKNLGRNKLLVEKYLTTLTGLPVPGVGRSFAGKYNKFSATNAAATDRDQILLSIFDFIRSVNLVDTGRKDASASGYPFAYTPGYEPNNDYSGGRKPNVGSGQVVPTVRYDASSKPIMKGFGRFITLAEMGIDFYIDEAATTLPGDDAVPADLIKDGAGVWQNYVGVRAVLIPQWYNVSPYYPPMVEAFAYRASETDEKDAAVPFSINYAPIPGAPATVNKIMDIAPGSLTDPTKPRPSINVVEVDPYRIGDGRFFMPCYGITNNFVFDAVAPGTSIRPKIKAFSKPNVGGAYQNYPFYSKRFYIPGVEILPATNPKKYTLPTRFDFNGGKLSIEMLALSAAPSAANSFSPPPNSIPLQKISMAFPPVKNLLIPKRGVAPFQTRLGPALSQCPALSIDPYTGTRILPTTDTTGSPDSSIDTIRSMEPAGRRDAGGNGLGIAYGDLRQIAGRPVVEERYWDMCGEIINGQSAYLNTTIRAVNNFHTSWGRRYDTRNNPDLYTANYNHRTGNEKIANVPLVYSAASTPNQGVAALSFDRSATGDIDRGISKHLDGPFINHPDEGNVRFNQSDSPGTGGNLPYFRGAGGYEEVGGTYFSPNRLIPSPVVFGSLPTGIFSNRPWETLLFSPPVATTHMGANDPKDHYLLDLFYMPVVEPFAISEPLSTAGKININCRIAPFGYAPGGPNKRPYIERTTGIHALLKGLKQMALANGTSQGGHAEAPLSNTFQVRYEVDPFTTIEKVVNPALDANLGYFKSATQICDWDLLLKSPSSFNTPGAAPRKSYWEANNATGDNERELLYSHMYSRVTTKSNVYTVHVWAQSIQKNPNTTDWGKFDEASGDRVTGEYRGSSVVERYIDPNDPALGNYDAAEKPDPAVSGLDRYYRFRILSSKQFIVQ